MAKSKTAHRGCYTATDAGVTANGRCANPRATGPPVPMRRRNHLIIFTRPANVTAVQHTPLEHTRSLFTCWSWPVELLLLIIFFFCFITCFAPFLPYIRLLLILFPTHPSIHSPKPPCPPFSLPSTHASTPSLIVFHGTKPMIQMIPCPPSPCRANICFESCSIFHSVWSSVGTSLARRGVSSSCP